MPVHTLFSSAATLLYAVSALLSGAQNAAVHGPLVVRQSDSFEAAPLYMPYNATAQPNVINRRTSSPVER